jgi:hypothetical protein
VTHDVGNILFGFLVAFGVVHFIRKRRQRSSSRSASAPWPYIRGTDLYRRSLDNINVAPFARQAQGLPLYHQESQWRDPPG